MTRNLRVNGQRLWDSLMEMAAIGATAKGGSCRLALSDEDKAGRDLFCAWCKALGCDIEIDQMGNIFARRAGADAARPAIAAGSHLDTQPHGGKFDGVYGVLAGLEVLRTLEENHIETQAPVEVIVWTNEEGVRFAPSMVSSGVFAGAYELDFALGLTDGDGKVLGSELQRIDYAGSSRCGDRPLGAFFEAHIEQGPVLEREGKTIGVVTSVQGLRWYDLVVTGQDSHAGSTPMPGRRNALVGAAAMVSAVDALALAFSPAAVATVGQLEVTPNSRNTIPGSVFLTVDLRHPSADVLTEMGSVLHRDCEQIAQVRNLTLDITEISHTPPVEFAPECIESVRNATESLGLSYREMPSGAGHDACFISRVAPTSMIFVPCEGGLSHNEEESAEPEDLAAGCNVLLHSILAQAG